MRGQWKKRTLRLKNRHGWKAKPGYAICAIDRGAIRFDYPKDWHVSADSDSLKVRDRPRPDDNCVLAVSRMHLPFELADQVPVRQLVAATIGNEERDILERKEPVDVPREDGVELAYMEMLYVDRAENRNAISRIAVARGSGVYCLITFDFWVEAAAECEPAWQEVLRSLTLGMYVKDPTAGPVVH